MNEFVDKPDLVTKIIWRYHYEDVTQQEIADEYDISRVKVNKILKLAMDNDLVQIKFLDPKFELLKLESELKQNFNLTKAIVTETADSYDQLKTEIARAGAHLFEQIVRPGDDIGITWGTTIYRLSRQINNISIKDLQVILINGGLGSRALKFNPYDSAKNIADQLDCPCYYIFAPAIVNSGTLKQIILSDERIIKTLNKARNVDIALLGIGDITDHSTMLQSGFVDKQTVADLRKKGAVGEILGRYYDISGNKLPTPFDDRVIGLELKQIKQIDKVLALAGGGHKVKSIYGALRGEYIDIMITDRETADRILKLENINQK